MNQHKTSMFKPVGQQVVKLTEYWKYLIENQIT